MPDPRAPYRPLARVLPVPVDSSANRQLYNRPCRFHGAAIKESTGAAAASFNLRDGSGTTGSTTLPYLLAASQSVREWFGEAGIYCAGGIFLEVLVGAFIGTVFISEDPGEVGADVDFGALTGY